VPGFTHSPEELFRWGIIRTPVAWRIERWKTAPQIAQNYLDGNLNWEPQNSGEEALRQIRALLGLEDFITNVNTENTGQVSNLPIHAVVETNAYFSCNRVTPLTAGALTPGVLGLVSRHVANQEMIIEAALKRDQDMAFQAVFNDPTTRLPIDKAWAMFNEIGLPEGFW
jgi:galacturan 1,4-alpha-galacturonidase